MTAGGELREAALREVLTLYVKGGLVEQHVPGDTLTAESKKRAALYTGTDVIFTLPPAKRIRLDLAKNQILSQASTAMLAQANQSQQGVLSLLRGG